MSVSSSEAVIHVLANLATNEQSISLGESTMRSAGDPYPGSGDAIVDSRIADGPMSDRSAVVLIPRNTLPPPGFAFTAVATLSSAWGPGGNVIIGATAAIIAASIAGWRAMRAKPQPQRTSVEANLDAPIEAAERSHES